MRRVSVLAVAFATVAVAALPAAGASGASARCAKSAKVTKGSVRASVGGRSPKTLYRSVDYYTTSGATLSFGRVTYRPSKQTTFSLTCDGRRPALSLQEGNATMTTGTRRPGAVAAREGLARTRSAGRQSVSITRVPNIVDRATTTIRKTRGSGRLTIVSNVGAAPRRRQATGAKLVSLGGQESATYSG